MAAPTEQDVLCPRCAYNLRGSPTPRCPECGLAFPEEQWQSGVLREHIPTWLDRCDPWQPHQVLIRSLYELVRGGVRPGRLLLKLDLNGPLLPAGLMLVFGTFWLCVLCTALVAGATFLRSDVSPFVALKAAVLHWLPRLIPVLLANSAIALSCALLLPATHVRRPSVRQMLRFGAYWLPASVVFVLVPVGLCAVSPGLVLPDLWGNWVILAGAPPLVAAMRAVFVWRLYWSHARGRTVRWLVVIVLVGVWIQGVGRLAKWVLPHDLAPPLWVYF